MFQLGNRSFCNPCGQGGTGCCRDRGTKVELGRCGTIARKAEVDEILNAFDVLLFKAAHTDSKVYGPCNMNDFGEGFF